MGYTTTFDGVFHFNKVPTIELIDTINNFSRTRHNYEEFPSIWCQWVIGKQYAEAGEYNVNCVLTPEHSMKTPYECISGELVLGWNGYEKFYKAEKWLEYLINVFFKPNGYSITGNVHYQGEKKNNVGELTVIDNIITSHMDSLSR